MKAFRYLMCLIPPVAVALCKKPGQFMFSFFLTLLLYFPGVIHAVAVVVAHHQELRRVEEERRHEEIIQALRGGRR